MLITDIILATQFAYLGEIFPTHIRAKGVGLGVAMISLMNVIWLQATPTAFANIGWRFYLIFIIGCFVGGVLFLCFWPDTRGLPLEEIAAIFGDADEVAVYQRDIRVDGSHKLDELAFTDQKSRNVSLEEKESV